jgi:hypothetical protein
MMGPDHGAVDHLQGVWHGPALVQGLHDLLPETRQRPAPELAVDARALVKLFRQIAPWRAGPGDPEYPLKNKPVVGRFASVRGAGSKDETLREYPFFVRYKVPCQAGLHRRYQLETRSALPVNPFCQHGLSRLLPSKDHRVILMDPDPARTARLRFFQAQPDRDPGHMNVLFEVISQIGFCSKHNSNL